MIRRLFRWAVYLLVVMVVLLVAGILLLDTIAKEVLESRIRSTTGMDVKIGKLSIGLLSPTVSIEDFKLYNTADFGGSPFFNMPELYIEYDRDALQAHKLHLKLMRLNLAEVDVVRDKKGRLNVQSIQQKKGAHSQNNSLGSTGFQFTGLDTLNLTLGACHVSTLDTPGSDEQRNFGIKNQIFHNIKTQADLEGLAIVLAMKSGALSSSGNSSLNTSALLQELLGGGGKHAQ